jgi:hypothetical protein
MTAVVVVLTDDGCAVAEANKYNSNPDRQMRESVSCDFDTKDLQDMLWPHLVV